MRTKKSAYTTPQSKSNGTKSGNKHTSPVQQFPLTNDMVSVNVDEEGETEAYENTDMLTYQDNEEDPDFDPTDDVEESPRKKRGRPSAGGKNNANNNSMNQTNKRGRKPTFKAAEAAATKAASNSPTKKAQPPPEPEAVSMPKKRGRQPKHAAAAANATPAGPAVVSPVGVAIPAANAITTPTFAGATVPAPTFGSTTAPKFNYLKSHQPPQGTVTEARLKEIEAQFALDLEKAMRNHNMVVANLREEFASKLHTMKAEWDSEKAKIWETLGRATVKKE